MGKWKPNACHVNILNTIRIQHARSNMHENAHGTSLHYVRLHSRAALSEHQESKTNKKTEFSILSRTFWKIEIMIAFGKGTLQTAHLTHSRARVHRAHNLYFYLSRESSADRECKHTFSIPFSILQNANARRVRVRIRRHMPFCHAMQYSKIKTALMNNVICTKNRLFAEIDPIENIVANKTNIRYTN